jgi:hypothetical protein
VGAHQSARLVGGQGGHAVTAGHAQPRARAQQVHVAADEGFGVLAEQTHQHLVERDAVEPVAAGQS